MCFFLIYVFWLPPILTMMHLCIMLYTYWTPLDNVNEYITSLGPTLKRHWTWQMIEDDGWHLFVPITTKWLVSGTDVHDDNDDDDENKIKKVNLALKMSQFFIFKFWSPYPILDSTFSCLRFAFYQPPKLKTDLSVCLVSLVMLPVAYVI